MTKPILPPIERPCPTCKGAGVEAVKKPTRPGARVYPPRCTTCDGKGKIAD